MPDVYVFDPTTEDPQSRVRGVGRYIQIFKENFPDFKFTSKLNEVPYDCIFINPFFNMLASPLLMRRIAKKQIAVIHDIIPLKFPAHFPKGVRGTINVYLNRLALRTYDRIITDSLTSKKDIQSLLHVPTEKINVVYPTLPKIFYEEKLQTPQANSKFQTPNSKLYLYVGDATWNKNLVNFARAIKQADVTCVFVGKVFSFLNKNREDVNFARLGNNSIPTEQQNLTSSDNPWNKELNEFKLLSENDPRFIFPGFVSDQDLISLYRNAKANILVSRDEGFGFSYLEAASQGTVSLLSDIPVFREVAGGSAVFVDPENPQSITGGMKKILDEETKHALSKALAERVEFFSIKRFKDHILKSL